MSSEVMRLMHAAGWRQYYFHARGRLTRTGFIIFQRDDDALTRVECEQCR